MIMRAIKNNAMRPVDSATRVIFLAAVLVLAACLMRDTLAYSLLLNGNYHLSIPKSIDGTTDRPFVYRALLPWLINMAASITPTPLQQDISDSVVDLLHGHAGRRLLMLLGWPADWEGTVEVPSAYTVTLGVLLMYASLVIYGMTLEKLYAECFPSRRFLAPVIAILGMLMVTPFIGSKISCMITQPWLYPPSACCT